MWRADPVLWIVIGADAIDCGLVPNGRSVGGPVLLSHSAMPGQALMVTPFASMLDALDAVVLAAVDAALAGRRPKARARMHVLVADCWAPLLTLPWSSALETPALARRYAREQLQSAGVDVEAADTLRIAEGPYGQPVLATVYSTELQAALQAAANRLGAELVSLQPLDAAAWRFARRLSARRLQALAVFDGSRVRLLNAQGLTGWAPGQGLSCASPEEREKRLDELWRRQHLRHPGMADTPLQILDLDEAALRPHAAGAPPIPSAPAPEGAANRRRLVGFVAGETAGSPLDAMRRRPRFTVGRAFAAVVALAVAALSVWQSMGSLQASQTMARTLAARQVVVQPAPARAWTEPERSRVRAVNVAIRGLNLPLSELTRVMLPPRDIRVTLVTLDIAPFKNDGQQTLLSITAEAPSALDMTRYVSFLSERPAIVNLRLVKHEVLESEPARPYRFTVEMSWEG